MKRVPPLLFLASRILETEPYRSDRFEVGFGLATRNRLAPRLGAIRFREKGHLLLDIARRARPRTPSEFAKKESTSAAQAAAPGLPGRRRSS